MTTFTDADRIYLNEMRAITTNTKGEEVLVGLTLQQTEFYMEFSNRILTSNQRISDEDRNRYLDLNEKHEKERLSILAAEIQLRNDHPQRH